MANEQVTKTRESEGDHSFGVFFGLLASGDAHAEATKELRELLKFLHFQAQQRGPKGTAGGRLNISIALTVVATGHVGVKYDVSTKEPKPDRADDLFFLTPGKNLTRQNPKQAEMFPRDVSRDATVLDAADDEETSVAREPRIAQVQPK